MNIYDVALGANETVMNNITSSIYESLYPKVFKDSIPIGKLNIKEVAFDIQQSPIWTLAPSDLALKMLKKDETEATFDISLLKLSMTIIYENEPETNATGSLLIGGQAYVSNGNLNYSLLCGEIDIPGDKVLTELLNRAAIPSMIDYLNKQVFEPIRIPVLSMKGVTITPPQILTKDQRLLGFSALEPASVSPPSTGNWPKNKAFVGTSVRLLKNVADTFLKGLKPGGKKEFSVLKGLGTLTVEYYVTFSDTEFKLKPQQGGGIKGALAIEAFLNISAKIPGKKFGPYEVYAKTRPDFSGIVAIIKDHQINYVFESLNDISFKFDFSAIPDWVLNLINKVINLIDGALESLITTFFKGKMIPVFELNPVELSIGGEEVTVEAQKLMLSTIAAPEVGALFMVEGVPEVSIGKDVNKENKSKNQALIS